MRCFIFLQIQEQIKVQKGGHCKRNVALHNVKSLWFKMLRQVEKLPVWTGKSWECTPPCAGRRNDVTKSNDFTLVAGGGMTCLSDAANLFRVFAHQHHLIKQAIFVLLNRWRLAGCGID